MQEGIYSAFLYANVAKENEIDNSWRWNIEKIFFVVENELREVMDAKKNVIEIQEFNEFF
jgi:hypothetical protein